MALGVVVGTVPWKHSLMLAFVKLAPALMTGNVMVLKPSPFAPCCVLKMVELAQQHLTPDVLQSLSGGDELGP